MKEMYILKRLSTSFRVPDMLISAHPTKAGARKAQREYKKTIPSQSHGNVIVEPIKLGE